MHLPNGVSQAWFHASVTEGGLGEPELMVMRRARCEKLINRASEDLDQVLAAVVSKSYTDYELYKTLK